MNFIDLNRLKNGCIFAWEFTVSQTSQWMGRMTACLKTVSVALQDPRYASGAVFTINFVIVEVAVRVSKLVELILPHDREGQNNVVFSMRMLTATFCMLMGNVLFARSTGLTLHPFVITAIAIGSLAVRKQLEETFTLST